MLDMMSKTKISCGKTFYELKEKRDSFKSMISAMQASINSQSRFKKEIENYAIEISNNQNDLHVFQSKSKVPKSRWEWQNEETKNHNTRCCSCHANCHLRCSLDENLAKGSDVFLGCAAFDGNKSCSKCKCDISHHVHMKTQWVKVEIKEEIIDQNVMAQISSCQDKKKQKQMMIDQVNSKIATIDNEIVAKRTSIVKMAKDLKSICNDFNYKHEVEVSMKILEGKKQTEKDESKRTQIMETINALGGIIKQLAGLL